MKTVLRSEIKKNNEIRRPGGFLLFALFLLIPINVLGQCTDPPTVTLSSPSGSTCHLTPLIVSGNTFGGSATSVTIKENGSGTVSPKTADTSPFTFTYTPNSKDIGKTITITVTTNDPAGSCVAASATFELKVNIKPAAPVVGGITQPTCSVETGSVILNGLPERGSWLLSGSPGGIMLTGTGTSATVSGLSTGTYTFTVTNDDGCISDASADVVIGAQPLTLPAPIVGIITRPTCTVPTGSVVLSGLPSTGIWVLTRYPGTIKSSGTGTITTITGLPSGTYNYTVTDDAGCISVPSASVVIPAQPITPAVPVVGTVTQPTYTVPTGSVVLRGLPSSGTWIVTRSPGEVKTTGIGNSATITALPTGVFTFRVTNSAGCTSTESDEVTISTPVIPVLSVTDPDAVCSPSTVDLTAAEVTEGSTPGLTYTYWTDAEATEAYSTPAEATAGTYYIKGTTGSGYFDIKPVNVMIYQMPVADAGPDQILEYVFETTLDATPDENETGVWSVVSGSGIFLNDTVPKTSVSNLSVGPNIFLWTLDNGVCPASSDEVTIRVNDFTIPTLVTPNMDGYNDYFVLRGLSIMGRTEIVIFDRAGVQVYQNSDYDNSWNGVDNTGKLLPDDTYFFIMRTEKGNSYSGYIVLRN